MERGRLGMPRHDGELCNHGVVQGRVGFRLKSEEEVESSILSDVGFKGTDLKERGVEQIFARR